MPIKGYVFCKYGSFPALYSLLLSPLWSVIHQDWAFFLCWGFLAFRASVWSPILMAVLGPSNRWGWCMSVYARMGGRPSLWCCIPGSCHFVVARKLRFLRICSRDRVQGHHSPDPLHSAEVRHCKGIRCLFNGSISPIICEQWRWWQWVSFPSGAGCKIGVLN